MSSNLSCTVAAGLLALCLAGCGKDYDQKKLGKDSAQGRQVQAMVQTLRDGGEKGLTAAMAQQAAAGLSGSQTQALRLSLMELLRAGSVELERIDQFGPSVIRATFVLTTGGAKRSAALLLVEKEGQLRWAGRN
jgi:hypothetical protein